MAKFTRAVLNPYSEEMPFNIENHVRFYVEGGGHVDVNVEGDRLVIHSDGFGVRRIVIHPRVTNEVWIKLDRDA